MATILYSLVGSCAKKLQDVITEEAVLILGVKQELRELQQTMEQIQCFLSDAEKRRTEDQAVNNWLGMLRDAMYDADDIIDSARFEGSKLHENQSTSSSRNSIECLSCFSNIPKRRAIAVKIKNINNKIEKISKLGASFLTPSDAILVAQRSESKSRNSSHLVEPNLVGKEIAHACRKLVDLVLAHKENKAYKLAIVGTGGVGKTTLAQKIYHDQRVQGNFKKHAWICVSQDYKDVSLLKEVLRNMGVHEQQGETIAELQGKLAETIAGHNYFLVLDDVWKFNVWTNLLRTPLHEATAGVILVTTRDDTIAMKIGVAHTHRVDLMSSDVGWELLWRSMNINEENQVQNLKELGIEIVRKCGCLPLAIKVIASALVDKDRTENEWRMFLSKSAWSHSKLPKEIEGALYLSYDELPHHLKQCFLYCAMYPEDSILCRVDLVRLWIAEGFVEEQKGLLLEDTAEEYYYELIHRNLLQPDYSFFRRLECKMHDLLRQLACHLSREECFIGDTKSVERKTLSKLRRITAVGEKDISMLSSMHKEFKIRTFRTDGKLQRVEDIFFNRFRYLRTLDMTNSPIKSIPVSIGRLIHLHLLNLNGTSVSSLPESIGSLKNLQTLNLQRCKTLHTLPLAITKLCNLRCLGLLDTPINEIPIGIGRLEFLNDLDGFPISDGSGTLAEVEEGWKLEELANLLKLRRLDIIKLERSVHCGIDQLLANKKHLRLLYLRCSAHANEPYSEGDITNIEKLFEQLIPPPNLEDLLIENFFGRWYPTWLGSMNFSSLKYLRLIDCNYFAQLPPIWMLPNLKFLKIYGVAGITKIGPEFVGCGVAGLISTEAIAFPMLEWLLISDMPNWEEWTFVEDGEAIVANEEHKENMVKKQGESRAQRMRMFPRLNIMELGGCPKLRALPPHLGQQATILKTLYLEGASCLKAVEDFPFLSESLIIEGCEGLERVSNLPQVRNLRVFDCPNLRCVEELGSLQQLWLDEDKRDIPSLWVPGLQEQHRQLHGEELDVYTWT